MLRILYADHVSNEEASKKIIISKILYLYSRSERESESERERYETSLESMKRRYVIDNLTHRVYIKCKKSGGGSVITN